MTKKKIAILFGGNSSEYSVSLQSAYAVISNIDAKKYETVLIGITRNGKWLRYYGDVDNIAKDIWYKDMKFCEPVVISPNHGLNEIIEITENGNTHTKLDGIFPVLHGKNGEDGIVQGLIELSGIPLIGCDTLSSAICMDKGIAHKLVNVNGIKTPKNTVIDSLDMPAIMEMIKDLKYPLFVKPVKAGSSFGISKIYHASELEKAIQNALEHDNKVIIEENIEGFEVGCAILGNDELIVGEVDEIELANGFFDYTEKYNLESSKIHMPARIDADISNKIKETAVVIYKTLGCKGFARVDMFLTPNNEIYFNEVNTIPGFTPNSRYPKMLKGIGIDFPQIVDKLIEWGIEECLIQPMKI